MSGRGRGGLFRRSEWILILYFGYTAVLAQFLPLRPPVPALTLFLNLLVIGGFWLIAYADSLPEGQRPQGTIGGVRKKLEALVRR